MRLRTFVTLMAVMASSAGTLAACTTTATTPASTAALDAASDGGSSSEDREPNTSEQRDADADAAADSGLRYGEPCTVTDRAPCAKGLFCLGGPAGGKIGFCTATCSKASSAACPDTPTGTSAYCVVTDVNTAGDKGCAFVCREHGTDFPCPGELQCQTTEEPPDSGQRLCLPGTP
jgi:hypothetical protein